MRLIVSDHARSSDADSRAEPGFLENPPESSEPGEGTAPAAAPDGAGGEADRAIRCPRCGATGAPGDLFCEVDGTRLVAGGAGTAHGGAAAGCPCGAAADDGDGYCTVCGHRIEQPQPPSPQDHMELAPAPDLGAVTDRGLRHARNEDAVALARGPAGGAPAFVLVVCDGVSSSEDADQASSLAARAACDALLRFVAGEDSAGAEHTMAGAIRAAHAAACSQTYTGDGDGDPPGTTIVAALASRGTVTVGWVGDSRAYWAGRSDGGLPGAGLLTRDHSWVNEVVDRGELSEAEALRSPHAHALTHCLGPLEQAAGEAAPEPSVVTFTPPPGCCLLLCSDGLWNYAPHPEQIAGLVQGAPPGASAQAVAGMLVEHALARGGHDNVTAAVAFLP
jgi:serine/threonine protein phosphatase PrpC